MTRNPIPTSDFPGIYPKHIIYKLVDLLDSIISGLNGIGLPLTNPSYMNLIIGGLVIMCTFTTL